MNDNMEYQPEEIEVPADQVSEAEVFHKPGPNKRVCAFLIDSVLINLIFWKLSTFVDGWGMYGVMYAFLLFRDSVGGSGPGKLVVGLQVIDDEGLPVNPLKGALRNFTMLFGPFQLVEYFVMLKNPQGKRLGDKLARTVVRDKKPHIKDNMFLLISIAILALSMYVTCALAPAGGRTCPLRKKRSCSLRNAPKPPAVAPKAQ